MTSIKEVFENKLKIDSKTVSIDSLFSNKEKLKNTNYKPAYQRNYVWDDEKATYFIESILLGTEIPPLIYFRNISKVEIIDGRQRYQTILRFINNEFKLKRSGLKKLINKEFVGKNFESLDIKYKDLIWETKLRVIEFSFNTKDGINDSIEENVKKEIFKRYNSGITPLKNAEIDKASFLYDNLNQYFKDEILSDKRFYDILKILFHFEKFNDEVLLKKIRELLVIDSIPIKYFSVKKSNVVNQFYEYLYEDISTVDLEELKKIFISKINILYSVYTNISNKDKYNRLISECLFWALSIYHNEFGNLNLSKEDIEKISKYLEHNISIYNMDRSSFAIHIKNRYENISTIFKESFDINFNVYLKDSLEFNETLNEINEAKDNSELISFEDLRINKPEPSSSSIDDIIRLMNRQKFIIRPQYQRNEVIDKRKASSIIESILLGIKIPPIFVYKKDGISEVIDGQQRLLTILGFLGEDFINTNNEFESSKKDYYSLNLKNGILSDLTSLKFEDLSLEYQEKIKNFDLWVIEIDSKYNEKFDPVDLFIRLNYKPYPIKMDSFEMWNSYISRDLIDSIKDIFNNNLDWFYYRKSTTRMENENILTALIYLQLEFISSSDTKKSYDALDYYKVGNKINFRLKSKPDLTKSLENNSEYFQYVANVFEADFLTKLKCLVNNGEQKNLALNLDYILCVDNGRRTQQSLYALWYFVNEISIDVIKYEAKPITTDLRSIFSLMNNVESIDIFNENVGKFKTKYSVTSKKNIIYKTSLKNIVNINRGIKKEMFNYDVSNNSDNLKFLELNSFEPVAYGNVKYLGDDVKKIEKIFNTEKIIINNKTLSFENIFLDNDNYLVDDNNYLLSVKRNSYILEYLFFVLKNSKSLSDKNLTKSFIENIRIPIISFDNQRVFKEIFDINKSENDLNIKNYFNNILNVICKFLINSNYSYVDGIDIIDVFNVLNYSIKEIESNEDRYKYLSSNDSIISKLILKMNFIFSDNA
ncbi:DUF262 domain-containing protein [Empedobacter sp. UBA1574]|uniref:DUF262 domain-containing protein n=1 Tax=Empedobacter sp. UBA1574 TaxID=1946429 RepID=UPI0025BB1683|nr:DUF262 domain-containing protein [Empedobacter sp. UBA1574]